MYYVYVLKSLLDNRLYTGFSSNLRNRIKDHHSGNVVSTENRRPLKLIYYEAYYEDKESALRREKFLKTTKGKLQLRKQIDL